MMNAGLPAARSASRCREREKIALVWQEKGKWGTHAPGGLLGLLIVPEVAPGRR